jgi:group I intron endonuclease
MNAGIYGIRNTVNGKWYVGSSINIQRRWQKHTQRLRTGKHENTKLQRAWNKYGENAWEWVIFQYLPPETKALEEAETQTIALLRAVKNGYNQSEVGGRVTWTQEMRDKVAQRNRERIWTPQMRANSSKGQQGLVKIPPKITEESRQKMSVKGRGRKKSKEHKKKIGDKHRGKIVSDQTKSKIADSWDNTRKEMLATRNREFRYMQNLATGNKEIVRKDDPRIASGVLVGASTGLVTVLDPTTMVFLRVPKNDEKIISGAYLHLRCKLARTLI